MSTIFWVAVILTSPFWFVLGILVCYYLFILCTIIIAGMIAVLEEFFKLFRRKKK